MPWDDLTMESIDTVYLHTTDESEWYGPWNTILNLLFPHAERFEIAAQHLAAGWKAAMDWTMFYIVKLKTANVATKTPVFFVKVKPFPHLLSVSDRGDTHEPMHKRFEQFSEQICIPKLFGISAMGPQFLVYEYQTDTGDILPAGNPRHPTHVNDVAPKDLWDFDIREDKGEHKLQALVSKVKRMVKYELRHVAPNVRQ